MNEELIIDQPAFNNSRLELGNLIIVRNRQGVTVCAGIIINVSVLTLKLAVFDKNDEPGLYSYGESDGYNVRGIKPFNINVEEVISGELSVVMINPHTYEKG